MFNFELYKEGLRKTRIWGVLFAIGMLMGALIQPIAHLTGHADNLRRAAQHEWWHVEPIIQIRGLDAFVLMPLTFVVAIPLLTLTIFAFLNSRNSSDFYHAIPHKRETLFVSFLGSVLTWAFGVLFVTTAISVGIYASSSYTNIFFGSVLTTLLDVVVISLLVMGGVVLAMSVTGTTLSNIAASGLILFFPRLLLLMFIALVETRTPVINLANFPDWLMPHYNLLFGFFDNNSHFDRQASAPVIYTLILGLIYLGLAGYLLKKRHSEMASNPGNKWSQPIIRIAVTFTLTLPALAMILNHEDIRTIFIFYVIAFIGYFAYEVFTARKIHSIKRMLPGLGVVILLNIIFGVGVGMASNFFMREVDVARISSVTVNFGVHNHGWSHHVAINMAQLEITESGVAQLLAEDLNSVIRGDGWDGRQVPVTFRFDNGREINRMVRVGQGSEFLGWITNYESYQNLYLDIPMNFRSAWSWDGLSHEEIRRVLEVLQVEIREIDFDLWYQLVGYFSFNHGWAIDERTGDWYEIAEQRGSITVTDRINGVNFERVFPLTELTPRALELYLEYADQSRFD